MKSNNHPVVNSPGDMTVIPRYIIRLFALILLIQGVHAGFISGNFSGEPLLFTGPESMSDSTGNESLNETVTAQMAALPLSFIPNEGQTDPAVRFMVKGSGTSFSFTNTSMLFSVQRSQNETPIAITQKFIGANESVRLAGEDLLPGNANYFIGDDPEAWRSNISTYGAVRYHDLYPGIDLLYKGNGSVLKREFVVSPGSDPSLIRMEYEGADSLSIDESGSLNITAGAGTMIETRPVCFQEIDGTRVEVGARYILTDGDELSIVVAAYDPAYELVIDPDLEYSTYLGGSGDDEGDGIAVDGSGNAYVTGYTKSTNFPTTAGAYQTAHGGDNFCVFITKLNAAGTGLVYSTYLGGSGYDYGNGIGIAVDGSGNAYVTGDTASTDFPTTPGAYQTASTSDEDAFVTKLNAAGNALVYSTYLGTSSIDYGLRIAVDGSGNAYVTGYTMSEYFPTTPGAYQTTHGGLDDAFVTKLNAAGTALVYSTYLGGSGYDYGYGIAVDGSGNAYVTGDTDSTDFPTTPGAYQTSRVGFHDAFVTKLNAAGNGLVYSTYLGGSDGYDDNGDYGCGIAVDANGNAYVTGHTDSTNFPTTPGAYQTAFAGGWSSDAFITKLNSAGSNLVYSTYLGGRGGDDGYGIAVDGSGNAFVTGLTSLSFPVTYDAYQISQPGPNDAFVTKLNAAGTDLVYSTYLGGGGSDYGYGIAVDASGNAYVTGHADGGFPTTAGAYQTTHGGGVEDAFITKFSFTTITSIDPNSGYNTGNLATTITGTNFRTGVKAQLKRGATEITGVVSSVTGTRFTATFPLLGAPAGVYTLTVTNTDTTSGTGTFTVKSEQYSSPKRWGTVGSANTQFRSPKGIAVDKNGYIYVADTGNHRVKKYNANGGLVKIWGAKGTAQGKFLNPTDIAVDKYNNVYVADTGNNRIQKFNSNGVFKKKWGTKGTGNTQFNSPSGIGVDKTSNVYVADTNNHRIVKFNTNGVFKKKWGARGSGNGKFIAPRDVAVDSSGYIYVADTGNNRVQKLKPTGGYLTKWGTAGTATGTFRTPSGIVVGSDNFVYVADTDNHRIQKFSNTGLYLTKWGSAGSGANQLKSPQGLAVNSAGLVYVADTGNHRVSVWKKPAGSVSALSMEEGTPVPTVVKSFETPDVSRPVAAVPVVEMPVRAGPDIRPLSPAVIPQNPAPPGIGRGGIPGNPLA